VRRLTDGKDFAWGSVQKVLDDENYVQKKKQSPSIKKTLLVPLTSDKGLCGAINSGKYRVSLV
jgi:F-type H+-transporting ATPase subunit gamma